MRIYMKKSLFLLFALLFAITLLAQTMPYPIDTINGQTFYRYPVQKGEGLFRISTNFSVSQEDIVKYNPELQTDGLKLGQTILIPVKLLIDSSQYTIHELQPKETLYGIAKKYGVKIADIEHLNPETVKSMRIGEHLLVPNKQTTTVTKETAVIVQEDIVVPKEMNTPMVRTESVVVMEELPTKTDTIVVQESAAMDSVTTLIRLAVLLPFMPDASERDAALERFTEFYEGLLLAVNNAQSAGRRFEIYTFDTDKTESRVAAILQDTLLLKADAIIGPAYPTQTTLVADFAKQHQIPMIVPFTSKNVGIENNPYILQFNPTEQVEAEIIANWADRQTGALNWIFFTDPVADNTTTSMAEELKKELIKHNADIKTASVTQLTHDSVSDLFTYGKLNMVVLPWEKFSNAKTAIIHLQKLTQYRICLVSEYAWQKEELGVTHIYTNLFETSRGLSADNLMYQILRMNFFPYEVKNSTPRYDLLGYDLTTYLITVLASEGQSIEQKIGTVGHVVGLQSDMQFLRILPEGGWMNKALQVVE